MNLNKTDEQPLPKLSSKYSPLVVGLEQLNINQVHNNVNIKGRLNSNSNFYCVDKYGDLVNFYIEVEDEKSIDFKLLSQCKSLERLSISNLKLNEIPKEIMTLTNLTYLLLTHANIPSIPKEITKLTKLSHIDFSDNYIINIPSYIGKLKGLISLSLSRNKIIKIAEEIGDLRKLHQLILNNNEIVTLPEGIVKLKNMALLLVSENKITKLPDSIGQLINLRFLFLASNKIKALPNSISDLALLEFLILDQNKISLLPSSFDCLKNLKHLNLATNEFIEFPVVLSKLAPINNINLSSNKIKTFPNEIIKLTELIQFDIRDNPINLPDPSFHDLSGQEKIQTLLALQNSPLKPLNQAKILVVGDERVGKTSVINRLLGKPHNDNQTSTQGIVISELNFDNFKTNIWDFAGQELTHQTHQFFLTERSLYVYVIDAQKEDNQARDLHWLNTIKSYSDNSPIIVVVNHCDQNLNYKFDLLRYKDNFQIVDVIYTSACDLNTLDEQSKNLLGDSIVKLFKSIDLQLPQLPGIDRELPESWHKVKSSMESFKKSLNVIEKDAYEYECDKEGVIGKPLQNALLKILNSIGTIVAFPNDFRLQLTQILKPEWVTNAVYQIVRSQSDSPGIYSERVISDILNGDYTHTHQQWLIDLLIKFEIGFRLPGAEELLIPMKLPSVMPDYPKSTYQKGLNIRFNYHNYGLLKLNTLPQLIVRLHHYVDPNTNKYWRHGVFVHLDDCRGVIVADESKQIIEVFLTEKNESARTLLQWIRSNLEKIEDSQIKANKGVLPYIEEIALFNDKSEEIIGYAKHAKIQRAYTKGRTNVELEVLDPKTNEVDDKEFNVAYLLGLYQTNKNKFNSGEFPTVLVESLLSLTEIRAKIIESTEDDINDLLGLSLRGGGFGIADQSRGGYSASGKGSGERDIVVLNEYGQQACIIEAMCLTSVVKKTINEHYSKLVYNYNTQGNPIDYIVTYAKVKNFGNFWKNYQKLFDDIQNLTNRYTDKANIQVGRTFTPVEGTGETRTIIHILVNFGVKP